MKKKKFIFFSLFNDDYDDDGGFVWNHHHHHRYRHHDRCLPHPIFFFTFSSTVYGHVYDIILGCLLFLNDVKKKNITIAILYTGT